MAGVGADALDSFDIGNFEMRDIGFKGLSDAKPFNGHFDRITLTGVGDAKIEEFSFAGFFDEHVGWHSRQLRQCRLPRFRHERDARAAQGGSGGEWATPRRGEAARAHAELARIQPQRLRISRRGFWWRDRRRQRTQRGAPRQNRDARQRSLPRHADGAHHQHGRPVLRRVGDLANDTLRTIAGLGYSRVDVGSRIDVAWNQSAQELAVNEVSIAANGLGALKLKGTLTNVSKDLFAPEPAVAQAAALATLVKNLDITVTDQGLVNRVIANEAKRSGRTPMRCAANG